MRSIREDIGGLGNILFKNAYLWAEMRDWKIPDIYVQDYRYFERFKNEIKQLYGNGIGTDDRVALHIRRGDYLKGNQFHSNLWETDYYRKAVELFPDRNFLVFCKDTQNPEMDKADQQWCIDNIPSLNIKFEMYEHGDEVSDLNTMAACSGIIGANSSFSFWAAYLGENSKKVVMPKESRWFSDGVSRTILPDYWIKI